MRCTKGTNLVYSCTKYKKHPNNGLFDVILLLTMLFKRLIYAGFTLLMVVSNLSAQPYSRAKESLNKGQFERAIKLYNASLTKLSKENTNYNSTIYNLGEAYRYAGNYRMADSLHSSVDYSKTSFWGYALTLLQQYRADKCLKFVRYHLKFDPLHPELTSIHEACELATKKVDESKVEVKTYAIPQKKERLIIPGFLIGGQKEKETIARFDTYAGEIKGKKDTVLFGNPLNISAVFFKGKETQNYSISSASKVGYSINRDHFTYYYNPYYYIRYKASSKSKTLFDDIKDFPDSLKSLSHYKEFEVYGYKEVVKEAWISQDKTVMVFSSNKLKGEGGYDLFVTTLSSDGWGKPINIGSRVNSSYNEISPFISPNGILYYSSNGRIGQGGYDIYSFDLTKLDEDVQAENLPKPFNSPFDDYGFLFHEHTGFGLFASTRPYGILSNQLFVFENKIINCQSKQIFNGYPEITNRNARPQYDHYFDQLALQDSLPKGKIYYWTMGDGNKERGLKFKHTYKSPGLYKATLLLYNTAKRKYDTTQTVKDIVFPEKDFLYLEYDAKAKKVEFKTTSSYCKKCDNASYYWDFGDGEVGCGFTVTHDYKNFGTYTVKLIMKYRKDKSERSMACYERVVVEEKP